LCPLEQKEGSLLLAAPMRAEMQSILDELQKDVRDELDKVSLERLADINENLLADIKLTAEENLRSAGNATYASAINLNDQQNLPAFFSEIRSQETLSQNKAWNDLKWDHLTNTHDIISKLQHTVREGTSSSLTEIYYTQQDEYEMTQFYAAATATSSLLTAALQELKNLDDRKNHKASLSFPGVERKGMGHSIPGGSFLVDKNDFTNDGIKIKNMGVIGILYEFGLPFLSSADGSRFRTEIELSNHLDALFKKNQLDKAMASTDERGWYPVDAVWTGQVQEGLRNRSVMTDDMTEAVSASDGFDPDRSTMPADESRDRCAICGINFKMFFDNDDGIYRYSNCREIHVLNDDAADKESEEMFVHVTCWRGLGLPEVLTMDQTLQETFRYQ
jgi:pre-mRNA cleavage complex 2 protein Pcf11